jgi:hypothetical protein
MTLVNEQFAPISRHFIPFGAHILLSTLFSNTLSLCGAEQRRLPESVHGGISERCPLELCAVWLYLEPTFRRNIASVFRVTRLLNLPN